MPHPSERGPKAAEKIDPQISALLREAIESETGMGESERAAMTEQIFKAATGAAMEQGNAAQGKAAWEAALAKRAAETSVA